MGMLKEEQIELVQSSFHEVLVEGESFVARFYATMFDMFPTTRDHFVTTDLTKLRKKVLHSLVIIIDNLNKPEQLADEIKDLGYKHTHEYEISIHEYTMMGQAFIKAMSVTLHSTWDKKVEAAWVAAFADVAHIMLSES